jgi:hypothetical protein
MLDVYASNRANTVGVYVEELAVGGAGINARGHDESVIAYSPGDRGVIAGSDSGDGVFARSAYGRGVWGESENWQGVYGHSVQGGLAGYFEGHVIVTGGINKAGDSIRIDDPLDPANKFLSHLSVQSPDMMNIYNGNAITNASGYATVTLPDYFEALNKDFRYQLTVIGQFAQAIVEKRIENNRFTFRPYRVHTCKTVPVLTGISMGIVASGGPGDSAGIVAG